LQQNVEGVAGLEGVIKLSGSVNKIRSKQATIKEEIKEMKSIFDKLNQKIKLVILEQNKAIPKPEKTKVIDDKTKK
jgi:hypothetical protein